MEMVPAGSIIGNSAGILSLLSALSNPRLESPILAGAKKERPTCVGRSFSNSNRGPESTVLPLQRFPFVARWGRVVTGPAAATPTRRRRQDVTRARAVAASLAWPPPAVRPAAAARVERPAAVVGLDEAGLPPRAAARPLPLLPSGPGAASCYGLASRDACDPRPPAGGSVPPAPQASRAPPARPDLPARRRTRWMGATAHRPGRAPLMRFSSPTAFAGRAALPGAAGIRAIPLRRSRPAPPSDPTLARRTLWCGRRFGAGGGTASVPLRFSAYARVPRRRRVPSPARLH
jgi:hypothetical protein